jgi:Phage tail tube protein, GTA-gp10
MSSTLIRRPFAGQERSFDLRIGEIQALERACSCGIFGLLMRIGSHQAYAADIRETIRLALIGGGETDAASTTLIMAEIDGRPLSEHLPLAAEIIKSVIDGLPQQTEEEMAEAEAARADDKVSQRGNPGAESMTPAGSPPGTGTVS